MMVFIYFRVCKALQSILTILDDLPLTDPTNQELFDKLETVRAKVKQVRNYSGHEKIPHDKCSL